MARKPARLADRIKEARMARGLSQRELDRTAGLAKNHVWSLEAKDHPHTSYATLAAIASALDVSLDWLATGKGRGPSVREAR